MSSRIKRFRLHRLPVLLVIAVFLISVTGAVNIAMGDDPAPMTITDPTANGTEPKSLAVFATGVGVGLDTMGYLEVFSRNNTMSQNSQALGNVLDYSIVKTKILLNKNQTQALGFFSPSGWNTLGSSGTMMGDPVVAVNQNGLLDVAYVSQNLTVWHAYQLPMYTSKGNSTWSPSVSLNVGLIQSGSLQGAGLGGTPCSNTPPSTPPATGDPKTPPAAGSGTPAKDTPPCTPLTSANIPVIGTVTVPAAPATVSTTPASNMTATLTKSGQIAFFYIASDGSLIEIEQKQPNDETQWSPPILVGKNGAPGGHPNAITTPDGNTYVFYYSGEVDPTNGNKGAIYYSYGTGGDAMSAPVKIVTDPQVVIHLSNIAPVVDPVDGTVMILFRGSGDTLWFTSQTAAGSTSWKPPHMIAGTNNNVFSDPVVAVNQNQLVQAFYGDVKGDAWTVIRDKDGKWNCSADLTNSQVSGGKVMGSPLTLGINGKATIAGTLQVFYQGVSDPTLGGTIERDALDATTSLAQMGAKKGILNGIDKLGTQGGEDLLDDGGDLLADGSVPGIGEGLAAISTAVFVNQIAKDGIDAGLKAAGVPKGVIDGLNMADTVLIAPAAAINTAVNDVINTAFCLGGLFCHHKAGPPPPDIWTMVQLSAGSNPSCPDISTTGWTNPASIGGVMVETIPTPNAMGGVPSGDPTKATAGPPTNGCNLQPDAALASGIEMFENNPADFKYGCYPDTTEMAFGFGHDIPPNAAGQTCPPDSVAPPASPICDTPQAQQMSCAQSWMMMQLNQFADQVFCGNSPEIKGNVNQCEYDAAMDLAYNYGPGVFSESFAAPFVNAINSGNTKAAGEMLDTVFTANLIPRRQDDKNMFLNCEWNSTPAPAPAPSSR